MDVTIEQGTSECIETHYPACLIQHHDGIRQRLKKVISLGGGGIGLGPRCPHTRVNQRLALGRAPGTLASAGARSADPGCGLVAAHG
jgi:hypothetical protein